MNTELEAQAGASKIIAELFPANLQLILSEIESHAPWIRCNLKRISEKCISIVQDKLRVLDSGELDEMSQFLEILDDYVWEHLNIGHWKNIPEKWRSLKSTISLLKIVTTIAGNPDASPEEIVKICDQGLLLGSPAFLDNILAVFAERLHKLIKFQESSIKDEVQPLKSPSLVNLAGPKFTVPVLFNPSIEIFISEHFKPQKPLIFDGILETWPALKLWDPDYIVEIGGGRTVPIEIGSKYTSEDWTQKLMTVRDFVQQFMMSTDGAKDCADGKRQKLGYLAQYQLFDQLPELRRDIKLPEYCLVGDEDEESIEINAWFGPALTLTPTHFDAKHNLLAQVFGTKFVRLFPPVETVNLYPHSSDSLLFNTSQVDLEDPLVQDEFPKLRDASYSDIYLRPGQVLYIPPKWWHAVQSLSPSFSVSFWFQ